MLWLALVATAAVMSQGEGHRKVLLNHVDAITLRKGGVTAGRRSAGVPPHNEAVPIYSKR